LVEALLVRVKGYSPKAKAVNPILASFTDARIGIVQRSVFLAGGLVPGGSAARVFV
jgi:hypothetical protein